MLIIHNYSAPTIIYVRHILILNLQWLQYVCLALTLNKQHVTHRAYLWVSYDSQDEVK